MPSTQSIVESFVAAINAQDLNKLVELMSQDHTFIDNGGNVYTGRDRMKAAWESYFFSFPNYRIQVEFILPSGADIAVVGKTTGSHVSAEQEERELVVWTAKIADDLVSEWRVFARDTEQD